MVSIIEILRYIQPYTCFYRHTRYPYPDYYLRVTSEACFKIMIAAMTLEICCLLLGLLGFYWLFFYSVLVFVCTIVVCIFVLLWSV